MSKDTAQARISNSQQVQSGQFFALAHSHHYFHCVLCSAHPARTQLHFELMSHCVVRVTFFCFLSSIAASAQMFEQQVLGVPGRHFMQCIYCRQC